MRLFVAIKLEDAVRGHLVKVQEALRARVGSASWARAQNMHLTLKFLGEVNDPDLPRVIEALRGVRGEGAIELRAEAMVCFPPRRPTQVIAAEFGGAGAERVQRLAGRIESACAGLGFPTERRAYRAHVTIARPKGRDQLQQLVVETAGGLLPGPSFTATELCLVESHLKPTGAEYVTVARFAIAP